MKDARKQIKKDNFMDQVRKTGFARVWVEIDSIELLKPKVSIRGKNQVFWQLFIYENLLVMYYRYRQMGHSKDSCHLQLDDPPELVVMIILFG